MSEFRMEKWISRFGSRIADFPNSDAIVRAAGGESLSIRTESNGINFFKWLRESVAPFARGDVPKLDRPIGARAGENFTIGTKSEAKDATVVAGQRFQLFAGFNVPKFDFLIVTARGQNFVVGRESHRVNRVFMGGKRAKWRMSQIRFPNVPLANFAG